MLVGSPAHKAKSSKEKRLHFPSERGLSQLQRPQTLCPITASAMKMTAVTTVHSTSKRFGPISLTPRFREANCGTSIPLEVELELAAHGRIEAVEKLAELWACDVILHISGVEVVSGVKNGHADSRSPSSNPGDDLW